MLVASLGSRVEFLTAGRPERSLFYDDRVEETQHDSKGEQLGWWCGDAAEGMPAMMTQGIFAAAPVEGGSRPERSLTGHPRPLRHIACSSVLVASDTLAASIPMTAGTHPQIAHVCKGGRTGRDGP